MNVKASRQAMKVALIYVIAAGLWILFSSRLVQYCVRDADVRSTIEIVKGWAFVLITGVFLHVTVRRLLEGWSQQAAQRVEAERAKQEAWEKMRESHERFSKIFECSPTGMAVSTFKDGRYLDVNEEILRMFQRSREEVIGHTSLELGIWARPEQRAKFAEKIRAEGKLQNVEVEIRARSGEIRTILWSAELIVIGGEDCLLGTALDITQHKEAESKLQESEERYRQLFELESDAVILLDCETQRFVDVNQSALRLYGYSREEFLRMKVEEISDEPEKTRELAGTGDHFVPMRWHRKKNGERFAVEITTNTFAYGGRRTELAAIRDITSRQQVLEQLQQTTDQLLEAQQIARLGSYQLDIETGIWTCSKVLDELFGITDPGFTRDVASWLQIVHPHDREEMQRYFQNEVLIGKSPFNRSYRIVRLNDGQERWVHGLGKLLLDKSGRVVRMMGVIQDITERRRIEQMLAHERDLLQALMENQPDFIYFKDTASRFIRVNSALARHLGIRTPAEAVGKSDADFFPAEEARIKLEAERELLATGEPILGLVEKSKKAETLQWFSSTKVPIYGADGGINGLVGISRDITTVKRAEERMNLQFSTLTAVANAIVITDRSGKIEWVNPAFCKLTGYSQNEAVGNTLRLLNSGQHPPTFFANLWSTILTGNVWHGQLVNKRKDGNYYNEEMTITPVRDEEGLIAHFVAIKQDVTEQREFEKRLQQTQKMEAIGTLAGGIAHDFNNILAAMVGYAYLVQEDTKGNEAAQENVAEILNATNRAKELVQQILTFSRKREQKPQVIKLDTVVKEAIRFLRASLPAQIKIELNLSAEAPAVLADPTQIYQVTVNLATNALHAMDGRAGCLTVSLDPFQPDAKTLRSHPELRAIPYVRLTVADTGHGMDAKTMERIFEPFFTTKAVGKGTGLGLAVVHGIVQSHNGVITVESQVGRGTQFSIYFPGQAESGVTATADSSDKTARGRGQRILLLDDEPTVTGTLKHLLVRLNYQATATNHAREALDWVRENPNRFDLVITDLTMPEINGLEVARQIRELNSRLPIILASGFTAELTPDDLQAAGIYELVEKPITKPNLADVVQRALARQALLAAGI